MWSIDSTAYRGVRAKLSAHQANLAQVSTGQRIFVTLDEACIFILWDGATLQALQTPPGLCARDSIYIYINRIAIK